MNTALYSQNKILCYFSLAPEFIKQNEGTKADTMIAGIVMPGRTFEAVKLASEFPYFPTSGVIS